jgi:hypothetical protein
MHAYRENLQHIVKIGEWHLYSAFDISPHHACGAQEVLQGTSLTRRTIDQPMHLKASTVYCDGTRGEGAVPNIVCKCGVDGLFNSIISIKGIAIAR